MNDPRWFWRIVSWLTIAWFSVCLVGGIVSQNYPREFVQTTDRPRGPVVQLRGSSIPWIRVIAIHLSLVAYDPETGRWQRWEVWQNPDAGGTSWGHLHLDLNHPDRGTGGGPLETYAEWRGADAERLLQVLQKADAYPNARLYRYWPGPNSNTFPVWVLREADLPCALPPKAIGKDYLGPAGASLTPGRDGAQIETPILGFKLSVTEGLEVHWLGATFGTDVLRPAIKTPLGRVGFDR
jgi:hypothetical protein